jgi:hypothetical protein
MEDPNAPRQLYSPYPISYHTIPYHPISSYLCLGEQAQLRLCRREPPLEVLLSRDTHTHRGGGGRWISIIQTMLTTRKPALYPPTHAPHKSIKTKSLLTFFGGSPSSPVATTTPIPHPFSSTKARNGESCDRANGPSSALSAVSIREMSCSSPSSRASVVCGMGDWVAFRWG